MSGWKLRGRRALAVILFAVTLALAVVAACVAPYFLAGWSAKISALTVASIMAFGLIAWLGLWACAASWQSARGRVFATAVAAILTPVFAAILYVTVLRPSTQRLPEAPPFSNTRYWQLSTGSHIAYSEFDPVAGSVESPFPIIYLHGGPGLAQTPFDQDFYRTFTEQGFRVYLYDQAGSGLSGLLPVREYSIPQAVEDLEAIRKKLGAEKLILIGHSWGSTLAASYMARYPGHVAKVVFHSPGPLWHITEQEPDYSRSDFSGKLGAPSLRLWAAALLQMRNPAAGESLLPQSEAQLLLLHMISPTVGSLVCRGDSGKLPPSLKGLSSEQLNPHFNPYVMFRYNLESEQPAGDPHQRLHGNRTPALLLFPECNYLPWSAVADYRKTFSDLTVYYIPRAGHFIQLEQPDTMRRVIVAFLLDQPDVIPRYTSDTDPREVP